MDINELAVYTKIEARYRVLDASGHIPFTVVFGFCRRYSKDTDTRSLLLDIPGSVLDVPYALGHGLLLLQEQQKAAADNGNDGDGDKVQWVDVDLSSLSHIAASTESSEPVAVPSPVGRTAHWKDSFTVHLSPLRLADDAGLAAIFKLGRKYRIRLASSDLGIKSWSWSSDPNLSRPADSTDTNADAGNRKISKLVTNPRKASHATFTVKPSLPKPPAIPIHLSLSPDSSVLTLTASSPSNNRTITLQTTGPQRFLRPWSIWAPEPSFHASNDDDNNRPRILHPYDPSLGSTAPPTSALSIHDAHTGARVRGGARGSKNSRSACAGLTPGVTSAKDTLPKLSQLLVLWCDRPVVREFDVGKLVEGLGDGKYRIRLEGRECRWWEGGIVSEEDLMEEEGRVAAGWVPPVVLESRDEVEVSVRDGKVV